MSYVVNRPRLPIAGGLEQNGWEIIMGNRARLCHLFQSSVVEDIHNEQI
jgi:hypothetical protein